MGWVYRTHHVGWKFEVLENDKTNVEIIESGWTGEDDKLFDHVVESTGGFSGALAGRKGFIGIRHSIKSCEGSPL